MSVTPTFKYEVMLVSPTWTDITADIIQTKNVSARYGVQGNGPLDSIASTGECQFALRNDAHDGKPQGYYSPSNAAKRTGWTYGIPFRLTMTYLAVDYVKFRGRLRVITPDSGKYGKQQVSVVAYDIMRDLAEADLREIGIQINKTEAEIAAAVIAALPTESQPIATDFDPGVDVYPYALDNIGGTTKALSIIADVARSAFAFVASKGDGTLIMRSRHTRATSPSLFTFDNDAEDVVVPADLSGVYNLVRVTIHPKNIDAAATTVLFSLTGVVPSISPGASLTLWGDYNDPTNAQKLIGGLNIVDPLVAGTDYSGNSAIDGTGSDLTASLSVVITPFAATTKFVVTNNHATATIYLTAIGSTVPKLQVRGKGVYDRGPQTYQSYSVEDYGTRPIEIDMPYQDDPEVGQSAADYIRIKFSDLTQQVESIKFTANVSSAKLLIMLGAEPGNKITVTEPVTGLVLVESTIQSIMLDIVEGVVVCELGLAVSGSFSSWILGTSTLGVSTTLGF